jgi:sugar O-acyltransferase (sialic acid O-acetyltransferase NeuD family)
MSILFLLTGANVNVQKVAIIGAGGHAREVLDVFVAINALKPTYDVQGFIIDPEYGTPGLLINDKPVLGGFEWFLDNTDCVTICAVGASHLRFQLVNRAKTLGVPFCSAVHPSVLMTQRVSVGEGVVIAAGCILTTNIHIGDQVHINIGCTVSHDADIADFATLSPGTHIAGNVTLKQGCFIGTGVNIIEKKTIGAWSIVGAGTTITADVPSNSTVVGVPGKVIKTREANWHLA